MPQITATMYDFALESLGTAEGLMGLAAEANRRAHDAGEEASEELKKYWFDKKIGAICLLVLSHHELVEIRPRKGLLSIQILGGRTKLHIPRRAVINHIRSNGYDGRTRLSLFRAFKVRPEKSEKSEPRPKSGPRGR